MKSKHKQKVASIRISVHRIGLQNNFDYKPFLESNLNFNFFLRSQNRFETLNKIPTCGIGKNATYKAEKIAIRSKNIL